MKIFYIYMLNYHPGARLVGFCPPTVEQKKMQAVKVDRRAIRQNTHLVSSGFKVSTPSRQLNDKSRFGAFFSVLADKFNQKKKTVEGNCAIPMPSFLNEQKGAVL